MGLQFAAIVCFLLAMAAGDVLRKNTVPFNKVTGSSTIPKLTHSFSKDTEERISQQMQLANRTLQTKTGFLGTDGNLLRSQTEAFNDVTDSNKSPQLPRILAKEIDGHIGQQTKLQNKILDIQTHDKKDSRKVNVVVRPDPIVAFTATTKDELTVLSQYQTVPFVDVITNIGKGYDSEVGVFRCPVSGLYQFTVTIRSQPRYSIHTQLFVSGKGIIMTHSEGGKYYDTSTNSVLITVNKGDNVFVRVHKMSQSAGSLGFSGTFSGFLIHNKYSAGTSGGNRMEITLFQQVLTMWIIRGICKCF